MASPNRPVTGPDHLPKEVLVNAGLVFAGHLDLSRLREAASQIIDLYPELNVYPKREWLAFGRWYTPPATQQVWDFKERELPDKTLEDIFPQAAKAAQLDLTGSTITPLGGSELLDLQSQLAFDGPNHGSLGWSPIPIMSFRATLVGDKDTGHTLLGLVVPHVITDAMGVASLIETWGKLYCGKTVPPRTGDPHPDLLKLLDSAPEEQSGQEIKEDEWPWSGYSYGFSAFVSLIKYTRKVGKVGTEERYIHFPASLLKKYRDEAREQLSGEDVGLHVSRLDVFCGMMAKLYAQSAVITDKSKPLDFYHVFHLANSFPKGSLPTPYLHNLHFAGWFPFPSATEVSSASPASLAITIRKRLNRLRTPTNVREQLKHYDRNKQTLLQAPWVDDSHGWGMISSWKEVDEAARAGFEGEKLVMVRAATQNPMDLLLPNLAFPTGDGEGGMFTRVSVMKGDWESMWEKSGLGELK